jgi:hypothetical protein
MSPKVMTRRSDFIVGTRLGGDIPPVGVTGRDGLISPSIDVLPPPFKRLWRSMMAPPVATSWGDAEDLFLPYFI